jgi:dienelactone hydrolase
MTSFNLEPKVNHLHILKNTIPKLQFDNGNVKAWQTKLRKKVKQCLGYDKMPKDLCNLNVRSLWKKEHELGTIEKIVFTSEPKADVTAYLCLPKNIKAPYNCMITLQGHNSGVHWAINVDREDESKAFIPVEDGDRDFGLQCMRNGLAGLCIEQRSFGERKQNSENNPTMCHAASMHAIMLGKTLVAERVYDVDRGIDYLSTLGNINMKAIGIMGNSGGGTTSMFAAAILPRISLASPGSYFCSFADSIFSVGHCTCNYIPDLINYAEMSDIMGLFAPKPVIIVNGKEDDIFPIKATRKQFKLLQNIYDKAKAKDHSHLVVGNGGHRYYADQAWPLILKEFNHINHSIKK